MRYLLDVNALIALAHTGHALHAQAIGWYRSVLSSATGFHTCSITELGFVRVTAMTGLQPDIKAARQALDALKSSSKVRFELIPDDLGAAHLPAFVKTPQAAIWIRTCQHIDGWTDVTKVARARVRAPTD